MDAVECLLQIAQEIGKGPLQRGARSADKHIVPAGTGAARHDGACGLAQAAAGAVAGDGIPDLARAGQPKTGRAFVSTAPRLQEEPRPTIAPRP